MAGGANPQNTQAASNQMAGANPYQQAAGAQQGALGATAMNMGQTAAGGMANYQNPYENQVVQQTMQDVGNQAAVGLNQLRGQATQAKAFGGARHGIAEAEAMKGYQQQALNQAGQLRQQGFNTALGASQTDLSRQLGAAGQLGQLGQQSFGYGQSIQNQQMNQGQQQQQMMQNLINAAKGQYAGYTGAPQQGLNSFLGTLTGMPNTSGQSTSNNPGLFNYMQTLAMM